MRRFAETYRALTQGRTVEGYRKSARFHSSAFWIWLVISVIVWVGLGFKWALLPLGMLMVAFYQHKSATMLAEFMAGRRDDPGSR